MKTISHPRKWPTLAIFGAATLLLAPGLALTAHAQGPQGGGPGGGGFNRRPPFATGTVSAIDTGAGTITIASRFGGGSQTIQTQGTTQFVSQTAATVADLKKGDKIEVQGIPTGITASALTIGDSPLAGLLGPGGGRPGGGFGGPPPGGGFGGLPPGGAGGAAPAPATATATGTVTSLSPLTISLSSTASLTLKLDPAAKVTKFVTSTLSSVKVGDRVLGIGTANDDGSFAATTVALNVDTPALGQGRGGFGGPGGGGRRGNRGGGGFGGPGGGGGFGGPGGGGGFGGPPPGGGFGGPPPGMDQ